MCGIGEAMLAFRVLSTVSKFQQEKAVARSIERQQDVGSYLQRQQHCRCFGHDGRRSLRKL